MATNANDIVAPAAQRLLATLDRPLASWFLEPILWVRAQCQACAHSWG